MTYAARRFAHSVFLLVGVSVLSFLFTALAPGDYFSELQSDPRISADTIAALRAENGLDRPLAVRYALWLRSVARGDLGYSLAYRGPVWPLLRQRIPGTLLLTALATAIAWLIAVPLGIWNAARPGIGLKVALSILLSIPDLLLAIILLTIAVQTGWLPAGGLHSPGDDSVGDALRHLVIPVTVLVLGLLPILVRHV
jgi:peptide/nickel transport system permease protein